MAKNRPKMAKNGLKMAVFGVKFGDFGLKSGILGVFGVFGKDMGKCPVYLEFKLKYYLFLGEN